MTAPLGLSIGTTYLVAARVGRPPVTRRSVLNLYTDRGPEVGVPAEVPGYGDPRLVLSSFVDRVGDPVPLVAADGSTHRAEVVLAEALEAMARIVDGGSPVAVAVPAYWGAGAVGALRGALRGRSSLSPDGVPPALIPDSTAALAALQAAPGLPRAGVVVLVDLGGGGTSISLADAGANYDAVGQTVRHPDFSGEAVDQALLDHVLRGAADAGHSEATGTSGTAAVGPLQALRDECRRAKERLSSDTATTLAADLPDFRSGVRVTRSELEQLIAEPLAGLVSAIEETLQQNGIQPADVLTVATVGGGAAIPVVTARLSERLRAPVVTTPESGRNVATGAALVANRSLEADAPTGMAPTGMAPAADTPTAMAPAAWAAGAAGLAAGAAADDASSATFRALAWSQDDDVAVEPEPYTGGEYTAPSSYGDYAPTTGAARPPVDFRPEDEAEGRALPWYKRPTLLFGIAAAAALLAAGGLAITLTSSDSGPGTVTETATPSTTTAAPLPPPVTVVTTGADGVVTTTVSQPPPPPPPSSSDAGTTSSSTTSTTTAPTTTTTTQTTPAPTTTTTTQPTTTRPATTRPTTTAPPTTSVAPPTTSAAPPPTQPSQPVVTTAAPGGA